MVHPSDQLTPKAQRTRAALLSAAATTIGRQGVAAINVMSVCDEAGVGRTSFYNYFPDVATLTGEVAAIAAGDIKQRFDRLHVATPRGSVRLRACFDMILQLALDEAETVLLLTALADATPEVLALLEAEIIAELSAESAATPNQLEALARFLALATIGLARDLAAGKIGPGQKGLHVNFLMRTVAGP